MFSHFSRRRSIFFQTCSKASSFQIPIGKDRLQQHKASWTFFMVHFAHVSRWPAVSGRARNSCNLCICILRCSRIWTWCARIFGQGKMNIAEHLSIFRSQKYVSRFIFIYWTPKSFWIWIFIAFELPFQWIDVNFT